LLQLLTLFQLFFYFAVDTEATFTSTERIRFYVKVSSTHDIHLLQCLFFFLHPDSFK